MANPDYNSDEKANIRELFDSSSSDLEAIVTCPKRDRSHPVKRLLLSETYQAKQVLVNTAHAIRNILAADTNAKANQKWLKSLQPRLANTDKFSDPASALSEIRAFGALLESGLHAKFRKPNGPTTDIQVDLSDNTVFVEVFAKQSNEIVSETMDRFHKGEDIPGMEKHEWPYNSPGGRGKWTLRGIFNRPGGEPAEGETVTENLVSKLASPKTPETQVPSEGHSILWMDFQDETWDLVLGPGSLRPLVVSGGGFCSGVLWHALYGWKDAPLFEVCSLDRPFDSVWSKMRHDGKFEKGSKYEAVICSFGNALIIAENPYAKEPLPEEMRAHLLNLPWFNWESSLMRWPVDNLSHIIGQQRVVIEEIKKRLLAHRQ